MSTETRLIAAGGWNDAAALHICRHLRAADVEEIFATRAEVDGWALWCDYKIAHPTSHWFEIIWTPDRRTPVAVYGVFPRTPGVGLAHMVATDDLTPKMALGLCWRVTDLVIPSLIDVGLHRVECVSIAGHHLAHGFLERCGARREGVRRQFGKGREDFIEFAWLAADAMDETKHHEEDARCAF